MTLRRLCTGSLLLAACSFDPSASGGGPGDPGDDPADPAGDDPAGDDGSGDVGGDQAPPALPSCAAYLADDPSAPSAVYPIDPGDGQPPFDAFCDMELEDGGWTLALKASGTTNRFEWSAPYWTTTQLYAPDKPDLDHAEAKLDSFNRLPFEQVLVVFETPIGSGDRGWVFFDEPAGSLLEVFQRDVATRVEAGTSTWLDAIPESALLDGCDLEGFNIGPSFSRVRLGVVAAGDVSHLRDGCDAYKDATSKLGIGGNMTDCPDCNTCEDGVGLSGPAVGNNQAGCSTITSFATVFVR